MQPPKMKRHIKPFETIKKRSKKKSDSEILHKFKGTLMKI